jgi:hypothetical protein
MAKVQPSIQGDTALANVAAPGMLGVHTSQIQNFQLFDIIWNRIQEDIILCSCVSFRHVRLVLVLDGCPSGSVMMHSQCFTIVHTTQFLQWFFIQETLGPSDPSLTNTDVRTFVSHWVLS